MIKNKYYIGEEVWYVFSDGFDGGDVEQFIVKHGIIFSIGRGRSYEIEQPPYNSMGVFPVKDYDVAHESNIFVTESDAQKLCDELNNIND